MSRERTLSDRGRTDRFFTAVYRRWPERYVDVILAALAIGVLILTVLNLGFGVLYIRPPFVKFVRELAVAEACMIAALAVVMSYVRRRLGPSRRWLAGERSAELARAAWENYVVDLPRLLGLSWLVVMAFVVPAAIAAVPIVGISVGLAVACYFALAASTMAGLVIAYVFAEVAVAPVVREVAQALPPAPARELRGISMSTKLLVLTPAISFYAAMITAALVRDSAGPAGRLAIGFGTALVFSASVALLGTLLTRRTLIGPVRALIDASRRVSSGDLTVAVPAQAEDELGALTHSFNRMVADLRDSRARIVSAADAARRRVERDLHDGAQQQLVVLGLKLGVAERLLEHDPDEARELLAELRQDLGRSIAELRDLAHGIYPAVLENEGLTAALRDAAVRSAIPAELVTNGSRRYPPDVEAAVYFCCLEALQNASKHAGEDARAVISLVEHGGRLMFTVTDDGRGFDAARTSSSHGLRNMNDRLGAVGGTMTVRSSDGEGTTVAGSILLKP